MSARTDTAGVDWQALAARAALAAAESGAVTEGETLLDPDRLGAREAASVIVLRDGPQGELELLMMRRAERAGDQRSGVWVYPGGVLDAADALLHGRCAGDGDAATSARLGLPAGGLDYGVAAVRECFEEVGLLFARPAAAAQAALAERAGVRTGDDFVALCERHQLELATDGFLYWAHWLTPPGVPKRFDTRFFLARAPEGQEPVVDDGEAVALAWMTPAQALSPEARLKLLPVTRRTLEQLGRFPTAQAALDAAAALSGPLPRTMPRLGCDAAGRIRPVLPEEPAWAEIGRLDPRGRGDVCFELPPLRLATLSPRVQRLTCANGSVMTGPGTNTYLLRAPGGLEVTVLDPGPDDADTQAHLAVVIQAATAPLTPGGEPGRIVRILTSHTHKDHSPAARRLRELTGAPIWGRRPDHPEWQDAHFDPQHEPPDGERLSLGDGATLRAVATPGHASNHLCWLLEEEQLLFTGDHVMQASTVVINPPDGDMAAYLASLEYLLALELDWLAPGHGFLMPQPAAELRRLIAHRLAREAKVAAALQAAGGPASAQDLVPAVYGDVPTARHGIAARSLTAHLIKLVADGRAEGVPVGDAERWCWVG